MPMFDLSSGVTGQHRSGATPPDAYKICQKTVRDFGKRGFDVAFQKEQPPHRFVGLFTDKKGTHLEANIKVEDEGETTLVTIRIQGSLFLGGLLGRMISANMISSRAEAKLGELLQENFAGQPAKRAPLQKPAAPAPSRPPSKPPAARKPAAASARPTPPSPTPTPTAPASPPPASPPPASSPVSPSVGASVPSPAPPAGRVQPVSDSSPTSVVEARPAASPAPNDASSQASRTPQLGGYRQVLDEILERGSLEDPAVETYRVRLVAACSIAAGATCIQASPQIDVGLVHPVQLDLVRGLGKLQGVKVDKSRASKVLTTIGASLVAQATMIEGREHATHWVPAVATAYALTSAVAEAATAHFAQPERPADELQAIFEAQFESVRGQKESERADDERLDERLRQVREAYEADLLDEEEYSQMKERVLADF